MTPEQKEALRRIEQAPLVSHEGDVLFTKKLAQQNGWTIKEAVAAVREYRRFLFLATQAGHPVSPSDPVDQVWHLHLMYTTEYWKVFCPNALGAPFHHHPSAGGEAEREKFKDWYGETLASYRTFFVEEPPSEFWPAAETKIEIDARIHQRVDISSNWILPKPALFCGTTMRPFFAWILGLVLMTTAGCSDLQARPPFDKSGPDFLGYFIILAAASWTAAFFIRRHRRYPHARADEVLPRLKPYEIAYLGGGARRLMQALLGKLAAEKAIDIDEKTHAVQRAAAYTPQDELESAALSGARGQTVREFQEELKPALDAYGEALKRRGLLVPDCAQGYLILLPFLVTLVPIIVGALKINVGIDRGRPEGFLVALVVVAVAAPILCCHKAFRSRRGDFVLNQLQQAGEPIKNEMRSLESAAQPRMLCLAVALFGAEILAHTPYEFLKTRLGPESASGGCGGGCGSGCGGGGGCGGGCGGCGG